MAVSRDRLRSGWDAVLSCYAVANLQKTVMLQKFKTFYGPSWPQEIKDF